MGGYFSTDKVIDNEKDYQKYQARLKWENDIIKENFQPHINYLNDEYIDLNKELNGKSSRTQQQIQKLIDDNRLRLVGLYTDIDSLYKKYKE